MRLFVAIPLPDKVTEALRTIGKSMPGVSWTQPDQFHLTLRFIGDVTPPVKEKVHQELSEINGRSCDITVKGFGFFPNKRRARVFWAAVDSHPLLFELQKKVERACRQAGIEAETRPFVPHITLAKIKKWPDELDAILQQYENFGIESIPVRQFNLYESRLLKHKAEHEVLHSYRLKKPEA